MSSPKNMKVENDQLSKITLGHVDVAVDTL